MAKKGRYGNWLDTWAPPPDDPRVKTRGVVPAAFESAVAADLREVREAAKLTLEFVAGRLGHEKNWLSRVETGKLRLYLSDYLLLMGVLRDTVPNHPAAKLVTHLKNNRGAPSQPFRSGKTSLGRSQRRFSI